MVGVVAYHHAQLQYEQKPQITSLSLSLNIEPTQLSMSGLVWGGCVCMHVGTGITDAENKDITMAERAKQVEPHCQVKWTTACDIYYVMHVCKVPCTLHKYC